MWVLQTPGEKVDWHQDWTGWMETGDAIESSSWTIFPDGPALSGGAFDVPTDLTTIFVEDIELGVSYQLINTITTTQGRVGVREITIRGAAQ